MRSITTLCLAALLAIGAGCGGSSSSTTANPAVATGETVTGALGDGSVVTLTFGSESSALALPRSSEAGSALVNVTGTITLPSGATIPVTGTYDPSTGDFTVSGEGYSLSGTYSDGVVQGSATTPSGSVSFVAAIGDSSAVTVYCGTHWCEVNCEEDSAPGAFMLVVKGGMAIGVASDGKQIFGTVSGNSISLSIAESGNTTDITGTIDGGTVGGNWTNDEHSGKWGGSTSACGTASGGGGSDTVACYDGQVPAPAIQPTSVTDPLPPPTGGAISDGTYYMTVQTYYDGAPIDTEHFQVMLIIESGTFKYVAGDGEDDRDAGTYTTSGMELTIVSSGTCPGDTAGLTRSTPYSATATELRSYDGDGNRITTFTKQ